MVFRCNLSQKQPFADGLLGPVLESLLNKVADIQAELTCIEQLGFQADPHLFQVTLPKIAVLET